MKEATHSKSYRVLNKQTLCVEESMHVVFDEYNNVTNQNLHKDEEIS